MDIVEQLNRQLDDQTRFRDKVAAALFVKADTDEDPIRLADLFVLKLSNRPFVDATLEPKED